MEKPAAGWMERGVKVENSDRYRSIVGNGQGICASDPAAV